MPNYSGNVEENRTKLFYAYIHAKPDGTPFYVGKGRNKRMFNLTKRNSHHKNVIAKYGKPNIIIGKMDCSSEDEAFNLEVGIIKCFKRMGYELVNKSNGGEGSAGHAVSLESRQRISATLKTMAGRPHTLESRMKISMANKGKKRTEESKLKMRLAALGKVVSAETRAKLSFAGKNISDETRAKRSASHKARSNKQKVGE